jgi:acyl-CoA thioester hydrolase
MHVATASVTSEATSQTLFTLPVRVYYEDTDAGGVVYYANYLRFCERARTEWLRTLGFSQARMHQDAHILFVVRSVQADYHQGAVLDDLLSVETRVAKLGGASMIFEQRILRQEQQLFTARVTVACMGSESRRATPFPPAVRAQLATLVQTDERH